MNNEAALDDIQALIDISNAWDKAMIRNNAEEIGEYMSIEWTIVGSNGKFIDKATFLGLVKSGVLTHDVMKSDGFRVRIYGETGVVTSRSVSGGKYQGQAFHEVEMSTSVFVRKENKWKCVLTHLSRIVDG